MLANPFPEYGIFPRWPDNGHSFIHPDDVTVVLRLIPSERVMRRDSFDGTYYHYRYGRLRFRLRPCLWLKITGEGFEIGDQIETVGLGMERDLFVGEIWGMHFVRRKGRIVYRIKRGDQVVPNLYTADQLRLLTTRQSIRPGDTRHPTPAWDRRSETLADWDQ